MAFDLNLEFILPCKPTRAMQLLTDPLLIRQWSGDDAVLEAKPGGRFEMFNGWVIGEVTACSENELAYTWKPADWTQDIGPTLVRFELSPEEEDTKVVVTHTGFPNEKEMESHKSGWTDFFFDPLEDYIMAMDKR